MAMPPPRRRFRSWPVVPTGGRVSEFFDHPAFQGGVAPFVVALIVALALGRTRFVWLAIMPAYATMVALDTGFTLFPPTVARKTWLIGLLAPLAGVAADRYRRSSRHIAPGLAIAAGLLSLWVFRTVLQNYEDGTAVVAGAGIAVFIAAMIAAVLRLRDDGMRCGAAGVGLGLAAGIGGILSASIGALVAGVAIAAACGAMLFVQVILKRTIAPGFTGALPIGMIVALVTAGTQQLALLPWYALPLLLLVPIAVLLPAARPASLLARAVLLSAPALAAAAFPIGVAWYAARTSLS
jgi:hypothetical protein